MAKYEALQSFLREQKAESVGISFAEIEQLIGAPLPASARRYRAWWSNNPNNSVITKAWLGAGFKSLEVDMVGETLVFARAKEPAAGLQEAKTMYEAVTLEEENPPVHPAYGTLKGFLRIPPDEDLTKPADPDWAEISLRSWGKSQ